MGDSTVNASAILTLALVLALLLIWRIARPRRLVWYLDGVQVIAVGLDSGKFTFSFWAIFPDGEVITTNAGDPEIVQRQGGWTQYRVTTGSNAPTLRFKVGTNV